MAASQAENMADMLVTIRAGLVHMRHISLPYVNLYGADAHAHEDTRWCSHQHRWQAAGITQH